jgi:antitoxin component of MazEF toxin-antitoxin module
MYSPRLLCNAPKDPFHQTKGIPREMVDSLKLHEGDFVAFRKQANGVLIKPKRVVDPDDLVTPAEAKKLRHAMKQLRQGKGKLWSQLKRELGL